MLEKCSLKIPISVSIREKHGSKECIFLIIVMEISSMLMKKEIVNFYFIKKKLERFMTISV